ncbi:MAG: hypothetical protein RL088_2490 [Verrucomicrobiota bacterium]|jgi:hypothetical protein
MNTETATATPEATNILPSRFGASIGGYMGSSYSVELREGVLTYTTTGLHYGSPEQTVIHPTDAQWREFRQTLDTLNVWRWVSDYPNPGVCDGSFWSFDITYSDRALAAHGDNNYPTARGKPNDRPDPTKTFNRFLQAIQKLVGREFE